MKQELRKTRPKAILVGLQLSKTTTEEHEASLAELRRLVDTLGFEILLVTSQRRNRIHAATLIGRGKLKEISEWTPGDGLVPSSVPEHRRPNAQKENEEEDSEESEELKSTESPNAIESSEELDASKKTEELADSDDDGAEELEKFEPFEESEEPKEQATVIIFNCEVSPTQLRNLERATDVEILDRNGVIIEIFHRHAKTREARLQIEIAQLKYMAPRLRMSRTKGGDRQAGGVGGKGAGETRHELDRRRIRDRIAELNHELEAIAKEESQRRERRDSALTVALIGYTNAGKSSLMRRLTIDTTYVADKLFATLGTTVRVLKPETTPRILISDTVGFINELPHELVASFRSTLDEARFASLIFHVVDASDPNFRTQIEVSLDVLKDLETLELPRRLILNKIDLLDEESIAALRVEFPDAFMISAHKDEDIERAREEILLFFEQEMIDRVLYVSYEHGKLIGEIHKIFRVLKTEHDEGGTWLLVRGRSEALKSLRRANKGKLLKNASKSPDNPFA